MAHFRQRRASALAIDFEKSPTVVVYVALRGIFLQAAQRTVPYKFSNCLVHTASAEDFAPIVDANQRVVRGKFDAIDDVHVGHSVGVATVDKQKIKLHVECMTQTGDNVQAAANDQGMTIRKDFVDNGFGQQNRGVFPDVDAYERNIITRRKDGGGGKSAVESDLQAPAPGGHAVYGSLYGLDLGVHDFPLGESKIAGRQIMKQFGRLHKIRQKPRVEIFLMVAGCHDDSSIKIDCSWVACFCLCRTGAASQILANTTDA